MNRFLVSLLFLLAYPAFALSQQPDPKPSTVTVNGSVELKEIANQASLTFSVKGVGSNLRKAVEQATQKMADLNAQLRAAGIAPNQTTTSDFFSGENRGDKALFTSSRDYRAVITCQIKIDSLQLLQPILYVLADAEVEYVSNITFSYKDELGLRRRTRTAAAAKAKEKAEDIANALGATLGKVLQIEEIQITNTYRTQNLNYYGAMRMMPEYPNPFNPVTATTVDKPDLDESRGSQLFAQTVSSQSQIRVTFELK